MNMKAIAVLTESAKFLLFLNQDPGKPHTVEVVLRIFQFYAE